MRRILFMVMRNIFFIIPMWTRLVYHSKHVEKYTDEQHNQLFKYIIKRANKGGNVILKAYGVENIPKDDGYIFYPNHQGMYDMLAILGTCPTPISAVAKKEVENVPFLKQVFLCMGAQMIDRKDVKQSMQVILNVIKEVKQKRNYVIFAEGTRSKNGNNTIPFKGGSFKAATKTQCPIVPVALVNAYVPFDVKTIKKVEVQVHYLEPLYYNEYCDMKTTEIAEVVRKRIQTVLDKYNNEDLKLK